jgi:hypothetical protein
MVSPGKPYAERLAGAQRLVDDALERLDQFGACLDLLIAELDALGEKPAQRGHCDRMKHLRERLKQGRKDLGYFALPRARPEDQS